MKFHNKQKNKNIKFILGINQGGYAILFAVVIVSIISLISLGLSNTTYKQLVLSSLAGDSQSAYFQSDTAIECAIYADFILGMTSLTPSPWHCGIDSTGTGNYAFNISAFDVGGYKLTSTLNNTSSSPCFEFDVKKLTSPDTTIIKARGYNSCDKTSLKTVEREIQSTY